jgi:hypothetical protein
MEKRAIGFSGYYQDEFGTYYTIGKPGRIDVRPEQSRALRHYLAEHTKTRILRERAARS